MHLLVIRHAIAEDRGEFAQTGEDDGLRPLTKEGKAKMARAAEGLRAAVPALGALAASPLVRARQTAEIVAEEFGLPRSAIETVAALAPEGKPNTFLHWLRGHAEVGDPVAIVGHETHLGSLAAWLLTGTAGPWLPIKKGGAVLLEFEGRPRAGGAALVWALPPALLRRVGA